MGFDFMGIKLSDIKDPSLRASIERQMMGDTVLAKRTIIKPGPVAQVAAATGKRIRQSAKPLMNKLESEWFEFLKASGKYVNLRAQAIRFRLGNGIWFKPDFTGSDGAYRCVWEVKGEHAFRGGFENLKVAASLYPEIRWVLVWKEDGQWCEQEVRS